RLEGIRRDAPRAALLRAGHRVGMPGLVLQRPLRVRLSGRGELVPLHPHVVHESGLRIDRPGRDRDEPLLVPALHDARRSAARSPPNLDLLHYAPVAELRLRDGPVPGGAGAPVALAREAAMSAAPDFDVIVVGAGHNGLAATALLCARGLRVLCLEKNAYA